MENQESYKSVKFSRTQSKAISMINAVIGFNDGCNHTQAWQDFRNAITTEEGLVDFWKDENFRMGVYRVTTMVDLFIQINYNYNHGKDEDELNNDNAYAFCEDLLSDSEAGDEGDLRSIFKLIEALEIVAAKASYHGMLEEDINDLRIILKTIVNAHQILLQVAREEVSNKEKRTQLKEAA